MSSIKAVSTVLEESWRFANDTRIPCGVPVPPKGADTAELSSGPACMVQLVFSLHGLGHTWLAFLQRPQTIGYPMIRTSISFGSAAGYAYTLEAWYTSKAVWTKTAVQPAVKASSTVQESRGHRIALPRRPFTNALLLFVCASVRACLRVCVCV